MPTEAHLFLDTTASPEEVKAHILRTMPFEDEPDFRDFKCLISEATYVKIGRRSDPSWLETYPHPFNIDEKISILFLCQDQNDLLDDWYTQTIQATLSLLKRFTCDTVLIMYDDVPMLAHRDGALRLMYRDNSIWDARVPTNCLSLVDLPYTLEPLDLATL